MSRTVHFLPQRSFVLPAVLACASGLSLATALPAAAQTAPSAVRLAAAPAATAVAPPATAASAARPPQRAASQPAVKAAGPVPGAPAAPVAVPAPASAIAARSAPAAKGAQASPGVAASPAVARWVALDIGHQPGGGSRSASGVAEHNFNLRFAAALESTLQQQGIPVRRLPTSLSLADRARRAHGAALVLSVHHDATSSASPPRAAPASTGSPAARKAPLAAVGSGFQLRVGQTEPLACARSVATQLQIAGRHFSTSGAGPWADKALGVRAGGEGLLLQQAEVPVLQVSLADIANPAEERLAGDATWLGRQAAAVAKGLAHCLRRPAAAVAPAIAPAAAASGPRRA